MADVTNEFFVTAFISSQAENNCCTTPTPCEFRTAYSAPAGKSCVLYSIRRKGIKNGRPEEPLKNAVGKEEEERGGVFSCL